MKWALVAVCLVALGIVGLTALDAENERSCRRDEMSFLFQKPTASEATIVNITTRKYDCDGFLPW
jgi:hypothetical protein